MDQHGEDLFVLLQIVADRLLRARLAETLDNQQIADLFPETGEERFVMRTIERGEAVLASKVTLPGQDAGITSRLSPGMRAFAIKVVEGKVAEFRAAFGGMAGTPMRAAKCEAAMIGKDWNEASLNAAKLALAKDFAPMTDMRASKEYRMLVAQNLLTKLFIETNAPEVATRLVGKEAAHV